MAVREGRERDEASEKRGRKACPVAECQRCWTLGGERD